MSIYLHIPNKQVLKHVMQKYPEHNYVGTWENIFILRKPL